MSSGTLRHLVLRASRDASPAAALALPRRTILSSSSSLASCPPSTGRSGAAPLQLRCFHPTPATRLYIPNEVVLAIAGGGMLLLAPLLLKRFGIVNFRRRGLLLARFLLQRAGIVPMSTPPGSWLASCDQKTLEEVSTIVTAGFNMAMGRPTRLRDQAYREASFQVPHEIARLNPAAPRFKVEEMAPLTCLRKEISRLRKGGLHIESPFDMEKDAQVLLYFPNDSPKASAAFLAVNATFGAPGRYRTQLEGTEEHGRLLNVAAILFKCQYQHWVDNRPDILRRIAPGLLPLIISFRGEVCGFLYDPRSRRFPKFAGSGVVGLHMVNLIQKER